MTTCFTKHNYRYCVDPRFPQDIKIDITDKVGEGTYGVVFGGKKGNQEVVIKFQLLDVPIPTPEDCQSQRDYDDGNCFTMTKKAFEKEIETSQLCADIGISPLLLYSDIYDAIDYSPPKYLSNPFTKIPKYIGVIVMERYGISLKQFIKTNPKKFLNNKKHFEKQYLDILQTLHTTGYKSHDHHFGNILVEPSSLNLKFIDMDIESTWEREKRNEIQTWNREVGSIFDELDN